MSNPNEIPSYGKVYVAGNRFVSNIFEGDTVIQEKIDGSQFSFAMDEQGELYFRSRNVAIDPHADPGMFAQGVAAIIDRKSMLSPGFLYRGEYLSKPKHNTLVYERVPTGHVIIFDIISPDGAYLTYKQMKLFAGNAGLEVVPQYAQGLNSVEIAVGLLDEKPVLGGEMIEGVVIKNYARPTEDGHLMKAKLIRWDFKETHATDWKLRNPTQSDILRSIGEALNNEQRWNKAIQRMRDAGTLQEAPQDISPLLKEIQSDILEEEADHIKEELFKWAKKDILRSAHRGFPEWYKRRLAGIEA